MHPGHGRLLMVTGLPGAGKSWLTDNRVRQLVTGLCIHDFHGDAIDHSPAVKKSRHCVALVEALKVGHDCVIADIEFCRPSRRDAVVEALRTEIPLLNVEYHCLRNQPDRCIRNLIARGRQSTVEERGKREGLSRHYVLRVAAIEYDVLDTPRR